MNILLVACPKLRWMQDSKGAIPVPLLYLAAALRDAGFSPHILDLSLYTPASEDTALDEFTSILAAKISDLDPAIIGFNCFVSQHFPLIMQMVEALQPGLTDIHVTVGGAHPSLFYNEILTHCEGIDSVIVGEGEEQTVALARCVERGDDDYDKIHSFAYRKDGQVVYNERIGYIKDLDQWPDPAWDVINLPDYYSDHSSWHNPKGHDIRIAAPILTTRSCPFNCNFCACHRTMGRTFRKRSPERVVGEMERLHRDFGVSYFGFIDDNVNLDKSHIIAICEEIIRRRLDIQIEPTCGLHLPSLDEEVVRMLARAGGVFARLPIEHGNDDIRNRVIGKRLDRDQIFRTAKWLKRHGMRTSTMSIMGFPEDTPETLQDTYDLLVELNTDLNYVFNLIPFPGTRVFEQAQREGLLLSHYMAGEVWKGEIELDPVQEVQQFYLKPRSMSLEEMQQFRDRFNELRVMNPAIAQTERRLRPPHHREDTIRQQVAG